uniref:HAT C-terminal dimerisation domain-containing protein n=1 Tax=Meloidogyne javanica TaxID=6303 RepID=A0A915LN61_MELJA
KATEELINRCKKVVLLPHEIRWGSVFIMVNRICEIFDDVNQICFARNWPVLDGNDRIYLNSIKELLKPFYQTLIKSQKDFGNASTIFGIVKKLKQHCKDFKTNSASSKELAKNLAESVEKRFDYILNFGSSKFCPHFALAALFDPNEAVNVNFSMETIKFLISRCIEMDDDSSIQLDDQQHMDERTKRLQELNAPSSKQNPYGLAEKYLIDAYSQQLYIAPLEFWKKMREQDHIKPLLRNGLSYLAIPGTTAPIERVFSLAGLTTKGIMNRTEEKLLNAKLLIHLNS